MKQVKTIIQQLAVMDMPLLENAHSLQIFLYVAIATLWLLLSRRMDMSLHVQFLDRTIHLSSLILLQRMWFVPAFISCSLVYLYIATSNDSMARSEKCSSS